MSDFIPIPLAAFKGLPVKSLICGSHDMGTKLGVGIELENGKRHAVSIAYADDVPAAIECLKAWARKNG